MKRAREEQGFALVSAIILLMVVLGLGFGLLLFADNQQKAAGREQASESAFNVSQAALNAQVGQVSRAWPGTSGKALPERCTEGETYSAANACPTAESLHAAYPNISPVACPAGTPKDPWGSALTKQWTTYVRDDGNGTSTLFNSAINEEQPHWDANGDGKVWIRAVGVVQCRLVSVVTLVTQQFVTANFPQAALSGNWFKTGNNGNGKEEIVDAHGKASQTGEVRMRCNGFKGTEKEIKEECEKYRSGQVEPEEAVKGPPGLPSPALSQGQLEALKSQAEWAGTYYAAGNCPAGIPAGEVVYVEGPCNVKATGSSVINSEAKPGVLIIREGTFEAGGNVEFWGVVYAANKQESSEVVATVTGNAVVHGEIIVDGNGGIQVGQSHKKNVEYNPQAAKELKTYVGTTPTRNTFRVLPIGQ